MHVRMSFVLSSGNENCSVVGARGDRKSGKCRWWRRRWGWRREAEAKPGPGSCGRVRAGAGAKHLLHLLGAGLVVALRSRLVGRLGGEGPSAVEVLRRWRQRGGGRRLAVSGRTERCGAARRRGPRRDGGRRRRFVSAARARGGTRGLRARRRSSFVVVVVAGRGLATVRHGRQTAKHGTPQLVRHLDSTPTQLILRLTVEAIVLLVPALPRKCRSRASS